MVVPNLPVALIHEHPTWSLTLIDRLRARGVEVVPVDVARSTQAGTGSDLPGSLAPGGVDRWINRVNAMPSEGRPASLVAGTGHLLLGLEARGETVVNGHRTWCLGASKVAQTHLMAGLGLDVPASVAVVEPAQVIGAAEVLGYPVLVKPNVGGSGRGIVRVDDRGEMERWVAEGAIDLGADGTGLVQRVVEPADGLVHRVEMLGSELFYATDQVARPGDFNYCAADGCAIDEITLVRPPPQIVAAAASVMEAAEADVGGVEYLIDRTTGRPVFFDFNPYSNFVAGRAAELGFDPIERYLDHVLADGAGRRSAGRPGRGRARGPRRADRRGSASVVDR